MKILSLIGYFYDARQKSSEINNSIACYILHVNICNVWFTSG